ncbi:hypothetical protein RhoFasB10_00117 [Rhodococcus sp. B10]|uniref:HNH domain-containing protein n=1 Tax=Rhodococcoides kyotonense TaxID=398843 RepID=A0A177Y6I6_9NOCA|nr:hypothetical protein [Rhodococcus sp. B10]OAK51116.1 hypothetical protein A3K89_12835 [Rhodococcus kyotonensis]
MLSTDAIAEFHRSVGEVDRSLDNATRIEQITALERIKSAAVAAQATLTADLDSATRVQRAADGVPASRRSRGIAAQIGLARMDSPHRGGTHLGQARILLEDMPHTLARLAAGDLNEWRVNLIVKEIVCLDKADRQAIDVELCSSVTTLAGLSDKAVSARAAGLAAERDAAAIVARARKAPEQRSVTSRPAPDSMAYLTSLLPMKQAISIHATLMRDAQQAISDGAGGDRTRNQIMADLLTERVLGISSTDQVPVAVDLVISDQSLLAGGAAPAHVQGYGPIPAAIARDLVVGALAADARVSLRRIYANPSSGSLTAMESSARLFPKSLAHLIDLRDRWCRTPWCGAPIRHRDHIVEHRNGGPTSADNGAGLCEACNHAKQAPGWSAHPTTSESGRHSFRITTPTGHIYDSTAPALPTPADPQRGDPDGRRLPRRVGRPKPRRRSARGTRPVRPLTSSRRLSGRW